VTGLCLINVKRSIFITGILAAVEVIIFTLLGILLLHNSANPVQPHYFLPSTSADGFGGLLFAFIFGFLAFVGYESGLPLTEETKNTTSQTGKGLMLSVAFAAIFYTFAAYATVVGFGGGGDTFEFAKVFSTASNPYGTLALSVFGTIGPWLLFFAAANSTLACCLAATNSATRVLFALGRARILPAWLAQTTRRNKVPMRAVLTATMISLALTGLGYYLSKGGNPVDWFGLTGVILVLPLLIIHLMTCISVFVAYRRTSDFHFVRHGFMPLITGLLVLMPLWGAVYYNLQPPYSYAPYIVAVWFCIGLVVYVWLRAKQPVALQRLESEMDLLSPHKS
jgi:amino acid transporter